MTGKDNITPEVFLPKVVFFNGPPFSGKDTAAELLAPVFNRISFADDLKSMFDLAFGIRHRPKGHEKDLLLNFPFSALTYRQGLIAFSEKLMKPVFGKGIFGKLALAKMLEYSDVTFWAVTDSGFSEEANVLIDHFGKENCCLVRIHRAGRNFEGDSRSYLQEEDLQNINSLDISNNGTKESLGDGLRSVLGSMWEVRIPR